MELLTRGHNDRPPVQITGSVTINAELSGADVNPTRVASETAQRGKIPSQEHPVRGTQISTRRQKRLVLVLAKGLW